MKCNKSKLCQNFILSTSVEVVDTNLVVNIPSVQCNKGCIVIAQVIPDAATINMPVVITIGDGTTQYPLVDRCGIQVSAGRLDIRTRYAYKFISANTQSIFKICGSRCPYNAIPGIV